jgi:hypothetical protein
MPSVRVNVSAANHTQAAAPHVPLILLPCLTFPNGRHGNSPSNGRKTPSRDASYHHENRANTVPSPPPSPGPGSRFVCAHCSSTPFSSSFCIKYCIHCLYSLNSRDTYKHACVKNCRQRCRRARVCLRAHTSAHTCAHMHNTNSHSHTTDIHSPLLAHFACSQACRYYLLISVLLCMY